MTATNPQVDNPHESPPEHVNTVEPTSQRATATHLRMSKATVRRMRQDLHDWNVQPQPTHVAGTDGKRYPAQRADTAERDHHIRALRDAGCSYRQIADQVGCSVGTAHRVVISQ